MTQARFDPSLLADFLGKIAEKKVDVYVTELDVQDTDFPDDIAQRDAAVAQRYTDFLNVGAARAGGEKPSSPGSCPIR